MSFLLPTHVEDNIGQFVGRTWLLPGITDWFGASRERLLILVGEPGTGKSMLAAWLAGEGPPPKDPESRSQLAQIRKHVKGAHFCVFEGGGTDPVDMAGNLASQFVERVPGFGQALADSLAKLVTIEGVAKADTVMPGATLTGVRIERLELKGMPAQHSFNRAVRWPLQQVYQNGYSEPMLIIIDGLDEALPFSETDSIVHLLGKLKDLPEQVRFLVTSRPDDRVFYLLPRARRLHLDRDTPPEQMPGQDDVFHYVQAQLEGLAPKLNVKERKAMAARISRAADRVFLYAHLLLRDLEDRVRSIADLETAELPRGLPGLYHEFLNREVGADRMRWRKAFRPVLGLIAVARGEGLRATQLEALAGKDIDVEEALEVCRQYLEGELPEGPFRPFHRSFTDFLLREATNKAYRVDAATMHETIASHYLALHAGEKPGYRWDAYGLRHLIGHMRTRLELEKDAHAQAELADRLYALVLDTDFHEAQQEHLGDLSATLADLRSATGIALARDDLVKALECVGVYRHIKHGLTVTSALFKSVDARDFDQAFQRSKHYQVLPGGLGTWERTLQLYLAWEAARQGDTHAVRQIMGSAGQLPADRDEPMDDLWDALLVRTARRLSRIPDDAQSARAWLNELAPARDPDALLKVYGLAQSDPPGQAELASQLSAQLEEYELRVNEGNPDAFSVVPFLDVGDVGARSSNLRKLLVDLAQTPEGQAGIDQALQWVLPNPYPRYRDIGLTALAIACLAVRDADWVAPRLRSILETALNREGVSFAFDLPSVLLEEAKKREVPAQALDDYLVDARKVRDYWGTAMRARSARAAGLFWQGDPWHAIEALEEAGGRDAGFPGYGTLTVLSLANRCHELGAPARATDSIWGPGRDVSLLRKAEELALTVRDQQFCRERVKLVEEHFPAWSNAPTPDARTAVGTVGEMVDPDERGLYIDHVTARWAGQGGDNRDAIKAMVLPALSRATTLDTVLGRLFGLSLDRLSDDELGEAVCLCADYLLLDLPRARSFD